MEHEVDSDGYEVPRRWRQPGPSAPSKLKRRAPLAPPLGTGANASTDSGPDRRTKGAKSAALSKLHRRSRPPAGGPTYVHWKRHRNVNCYKCLLAKHWRSWTRRLPMLPPGVALSDVPIEVQAQVKPTWVAVAADDDGLEAVHCLVCRVSLRPPPSGLAQKLLKHHQSRRHQGCVKDMFQTELGPHGRSLAGAPPSHAFRLAWDAAPQTCVLVGENGARKTRHMQYCIYEALVQRDREFLSKAEAITFIRDESKGRLLVRFIAASSTLERHAGLLGVARLSGSDAFDILEATRGIIRTFCAPSVAPDTTAVVALYSLASK